MARPERNNVDYFPFICDDGNKMFYLEETYGNDGFATFVKILRELAKTSFHYLDLSKNTTQMFLSAKCKVSKDILNSIISDLVELEKFDAVLWNENKIIWCQDFIDSIQDAYSKRKNKCITYEGLIQRLESLGIRKLSKLPLKGGINTQSIVEYSIEEENKEKETKIEDEFFEKISNYFSQTTEHLKRNVWSSLNHLKNKNQFEEFKKQTNAYIEFKKISGEKIHSWNSYFSDWMNQDWIDKLQKIKKIEVKKEKVAFTVN